MAAKAREARLLPIALILLGALGLATGAYFLHAHVHHTIGTGAIALGALFEVAGLGLGLRGWLAQRTTGAKGLKRPTLSKKAQSIMAAIIIGGATLGSFAYVTGVISHEANGTSGLSLSVTSANEVTYPDGSVGVSVDVTASGGAPPYTFAATWGDSVNQTSTTGNFTRIFFGSGIPLASLISITASSANQGVGFLSLSLPTETPVVGAAQSSKVFQIVPGAGGSTNNAGSAPNYLAVVNASATTTVSGAYSLSTSVSSSASASTSSSSNTTSTSSGFELVVLVKGQSSGQAIAGARVSLDGSPAQATAPNGTVIFLGVLQGVHTVRVSYNGWSTVAFPFVTAENPPETLDISVPGQ